MTNKASNSGEKDDVLPIHMAQFVVTRFIQDLSPSARAKFESEVEKFSSSDGMMDFFRLNCSEFDKKFEDFTNEFLNLYVRKKH